MAPVVNYALNEGQAAGSEQILDFLFSDEDEMNLTGPAGTGKTHLMRYVKEETIRRYKEMCDVMGKPVIYRDVQMTATTHKAAAVLSTSIGSEARTVHSYFGLIPTVDYNTGVTRLTRNPKTWTKKFNEIMFIDEASMIDRQLYNEIKLSCENCKIIFVGDMYQLNPVGEFVSRVYSQNLRTVELTQQMRNSGQPALMALCEQYREVVRTGEFSPISLVPGVIDHLEGEALQAEIDKHFINMNTNDRILSYDNQSVIENNDYIRDLRSLPEIFQQGEHLINVTPTKVGKVIIPAETEIQILSMMGEEMAHVGKDKTGEDLSIRCRRYSILTSSGYIEVLVPINRDYFRQLLSYFKSIKNWRSYYHLKDGFADIRPRDSSTVHKAQGSTHDTVFVDLSNLSRNNMIHELQRMLYVAFSRPKQRLILAGDLNDRYGSIIQGK